MSSDQDIVTQVGKMGDTLLIFLQTDKEAKAFLYVDAVLHFARCGKAIEVRSLMSQHSLVAISCLVVNKFVFGIRLRIVFLFLFL